MLTLGRRCCMTGPAAAWTGTRPTSPPRISQEPPGNLPRLAAMAARQAAMAARKTTAYPAVTDRNFNESANRRSARRREFDVATLIAFRFGCIAPTGNVADRLPVVDFG